jgi:DNA-binding NarL/FixJ family response regulator
MQSILIIDDNAIFRRTVEAILTSRFPALQVYKTQTTAGALRICRTQQPSLVLMDISLSRTNGLELLTAIRTGWPNIHIAVYTDKDTLEYQQASYKKGANYFFSKSAGNGRSLIGAVCTCLSTGRECPAAASSFLSSQARAR